VDSVIFTTVGRDTGNFTDGFTHAYCAGVENPQALKKYLTDLVHREGDLLFCQPNLSSIGYGSLCRAL